MLDLLGAYLDNTRRHPGGLHQCGKVSSDRCTSLDNMKLLICCTFGLKQPIHAVNCNINGTPKMSIVGRKDVVLSRRRRSGRRCRHHFDCCTG